jgi:mannonate dehydratase
LGEDIEKIAIKWKGKINFIHIRDVVGSPVEFRETFHDNGPTDMAKMMRLYN